jgi:hypothetical protein
MQRPDVGGVYQAAGNLEERIVFHSHAQGNAESYVMDSEGAM